MTLIALALGPTYSNATFGQVNGFVLLSCVVFITFSQRLPIVAGLLLAAGAWLKIYPILMIAVAAWSKQSWRAVAYTAAAGVLLLVVSLPIIPVSAHRSFLTEVLPARIDKTAIHISNQSLVAFAARRASPRGDQADGSPARRAGVLLRRGADGASRRRVFAFADSWPSWLQNLLYSRYLLATVALAVLKRSGPGANDEWLGRAV